MYIKIYIPILGLSGAFLCNFVDQPFIGVLSSAGPEGEGREREKKICQETKSPHVCCKCFQSLSERNIHLFSQWPRLLTQLLGK